MSLFVVADFDSEEGKETLKQALEFLVRFGFVAWIILYVLIGFCSRRRLLSRVLRSFTIPLRHLTIQQEPQYHPLSHI